MIQSFRRSGRRSGPCSYIRWQFGYRAVWQGGQVQIMAHLLGDAMRHRGRRARAVCRFWLVIFCAVLTTPAWAGEGDAALDRLWRLDPSAPPPELQRDASDEARELVTLEDAVALAFQANRLVKSPERLQFIAESVRKAYVGVLDAHHALAIREEQWKASREVERLVGEMAHQGKASPSDVLRARSALAKTIQDLQDSRREFVAQTRQLNHLMGRDLQARLRVRPEPDGAPFAGLRGGSAAAPSGD